MGDERCLHEWHIDTLVLMALTSTAKFYCGKCKSLIQTVYPAELTAREVWPSLRDDHGEYAHGEYAHGEVE